MNDGQPNWFVHSFEVVRLHLITGSRSISIEKAPPIRDALRRNPLPSERCQQTLLIPVTLSAPKGRSDPIGLAAGTCPRTINVREADHAVAVQNCTLSQEPKTQMRTLRAQAANLIRGGPSHVLNRLCKPFCVQPAQSIEDFERPSVMAVLRKSDESEDQSCRIGRTSANCRKAERYCQ